MLKKLISVTALVASISLFSTHATDKAPSKNALPTVQVKGLKGEKISTASFSNNGKPIIISFWATWCKPCILELSTIHEQYEQWQKETGVKIIAISIDDARQSARVAPFVKTKGWEYDVFIDENSDFRRAMNVNDIPHTFLLNGKGEVVWQHTSYSPGQEAELYEKVKQLAAEGTK